MELSQKSVSSTVESPGAKIKSRGRSSDDMHQKIAPPEPKLTNFEKLKESKSEIANIG